MGWAIGPVNQDANTTYVWTAHGFNREPGSVVCMAIPSGVGDDLTSFETSVHQPTIQEEQSSRDPYKRYRLRVKNNGHNSSFYHVGIG